MLIFAFALIYLLLTLRGSLILKILAKTHPPFTMRKPKMIPLTPLASYAGEPFNQQVFEHPPSTVRWILFASFIA